MREQSAWIDTTAAKHIRQSSKVHMREGTSGKACAQEVKHELKRLRSERKHACIHERGKAYVCERGKAHER